MHVNPFAAKARKFVTRTGEPLAGNRSVTAFKALGSGRSQAMASADPLVASNGEFNVSSKKELVNAIASLMQIASQGGIMNADVAQASADVQNDRRQLLEEAKADRSGPAWQALGETLGDTVQETLGREGFTRRTMQLKVLGPQETAKVRIRRHDAVAWFVTTNPKVVRSEVRSPYVYPAQFNIIAYILSEEGEIAEAGPEFLEEKYRDGLENVLKVEDQTWRNLANQAAPTFNDVFYFSTFTPTVFSALRTQVRRWGIPVTNAVVSFDILDDIYTDTEFSAWYSPIEKHEVALEGNLGRIMGVDIITDGYRYETLQVLQPGEVYFCGAPQSLGVVCERQAVKSESITTFNLGEPMRGWFQILIECMTMPNARAIARGIRA